MVGAGQLARMTAPAAIALGVGLRVLAADARDSAAAVVPQPRVGDYTSIKDLRAFARGCAVVTFDHEHVPSEHLRTLAREGVAVRPGPDALLHTQDKAVMRARLTRLGVPVPAWRGAGSAEEVAAFGAEYGWPVVLKAVRGGYDGRGVWIVPGPDDVERVLAGLAGMPLLAEQHVPFRRELAALVARSPYGQAAAYPVVETVQRDGICTEVLAPAPGLPAERAVAAQQLALRIAGELEVTGLLAVEMFETVDGGLLVNELAMRPHNSGHWTIDGARTSQFEQHLRAVLDLPLGAPTMLAPYAVMANVLGGHDPDVYARYPHVLARDPELKVHMYGKESRPGRKLGHVTAVGAGVEELRARARHAAAYLAGREEETG
ncbi:MAG: 5-(carboxyamino)imidazole ribonucleotide synthase [Acidothermales bacterium]|nr:5-(carboxyamino)imidazole ribonucleotide synthase [Acidothermales bacterium]